MNDDDIAVVTKYDDMQALKMGKKKKVKHSSSECLLGEGNDHGNKKCVSNW